MTTVEARAPDFEWPPAAGLLAELVPSPTVVLDENGVVRMANAAVEKLVGGSLAEVAGRPFPEALALPEEAPTVQRCLAAALTGELCTCRTTVRTADGREVRMEWRLARGRAGGAAVATGQPVEAPAREAPSFPGEVRFEVHVDPARFGVVSRAFDGAPVKPGEACHQALAGEPRPCPGCPLLDLAAGGADTAVVLEPSPPDRLRLVSVRATGRDTVAVSERRLDRPVLDSLLSARLAALARKGRLSMREQQVLGHLAAGHPPAEIAQALGITPRTVKFHQANLLAKLGADSRVDLLRQLL